MAERIIDRLDKYMREKGINDNQVTVNAGLSIGLIGNARRGTHDLGKKAIDKILNYYQDLNRYWLLTGDGKMLNGNFQTFEPILSKEKSLQKVPLFELEASAGFSTLYQDSPELVTDYITIPNLPPVDGAIYAKGDSMSPLIASGDIVIFKRVELLPDNILWGHIYIVSYTIDGDSFTVLKYVRKSTCSGCVRLESYNVRYDPQDIPANSITALALVKASITFHTIG